MSKIRRSITVALTLASFHCQAIMGGHECSSTEWTGVGIISGWDPNLGQYVNYGSGVCISNRYVLSAGHVSGVSVSTHFTLPNGVTYASATPTTRFLRPGSTNSYYDIVLLDFGANAFSTYYPMFGGDDQTAYEVVMVGYGNYGSYSSDDPFGWTPVANSWFSQRRAGRNVMLPERVGGTEPQTYISSDFDHPEFNYDPVEEFDRFDDGLAVEDECQLLGGDSGGPSFVYRNGAWHVIGIHVSAAPSTYFAGTNFGYGALSNDLFIPYFYGVISAAMGG